jgi:uncharacterized membrane protein YfcA
MDFRPGILMIAGTVPGVELGAQIIEHLKRAYVMDQVIGGVYVVLLLAISTFMAWEGWQTVRHEQSSTNRPVQERRAPFACLL